MNAKRNIFLSLGVVIALAVTAFMVQSCGIYSFTGTSIQPDVKTITIPFFEYKALKVNPSLSNQLTEALQEKFRRFTRLELIEEEGDLEVAGAVVGYDVRATAITATEQAAQNRLTVSVKVSFTNRKYPEESFPEKSFSAYADFDATQTLDAVEATLCDEIVEKLCEDIFNGTVANNKWWRSPKNKSCFTNWKWLNGGYVCTR